MAPIPYELTAPQTASRITTGDDKSNPLLPYQIAVSVCSTLFVATFLALVYTHYRYRRILHELAVMSQLSYRLKQTLRERDDQLTALELKMVPELTISSEEEDARRFFDEMGRAAFDGGDRDGVDRGVGLAPGDVPRRESVATKISYDGRPEDGGQQAIAMRIISPRTLFC